MSKLFSIYMREMHYYFASWHLYLVSAFVLLIDGILFQAFAVGKENKLSEVVLADFFYFSSGIVMVAAVLITMRLIAEERQLGTDVLYYTSSISSRLFVWAKFLAACTIILFLLLISLYMPLLIMIYGKVSLAQIVTGYLGLFLLGCSVCAIGLFASAVAPSQWIASVLGAGITVILLLLWLLADIVSEPYSTVFSYLAIHNMHFQGFQHGLFNIRDIVYYTSLTAFFVELSAKSM